MDAYRIVRRYREIDRVEVVKTGLSLKNAEGHCRSPRTSSTTCTTPEGLARTAEFGPWFHGYESEAVKKPFGLFHVSITRALMSVYR